MVISVCKEKLRRGYTRSSFSHRITWVIVGDFWEEIVFLAYEQAPKKSASEASREGPEGELKSEEPADKGFMPPFQSTCRAPDSGATSDWSGY